MPTPRKPRRPCRYCSQPLPRAIGAYCTIRCQADHRREVALAKMRVTGLCPVTRPPGVKRLLVALRGHRCAVCGLAEWQGQPIPLVLDHVNGDASDRREANLRLVCGNCDMLLPTYKGRNRGRGRFARRARYRDGKSY